MAFAVVAFVAAVVGTRQVNLEEWRKGFQAGMRLEGYILQSQHP